MLKDIDLEQWQKASLYRQRQICDPKLLQFGSNDYLGLSQHPQVVKAAQHALDRYGVGAGASQFVAGYTKLHQELEERAASFFQRDKALLFGSGYLANIGLLVTLYHKGDGIFQDRNNHASLIDGGQYSDARVIRYPHNNIETLTDALNNADNKNRVIVSDAVFSVDGNVAQVKKLSELAIKHQAELAIDEAHSVGLLGSKGAGLCSEKKIKDSIIIYSFGKSIGGYGAIIAGDANTIEKLTQFCRTSRYTTALPAALAAAAIQSMNIIEENIEPRERLKTNILHFNKGIEDRHLPFLKSSTAIHALPIDNAKSCLELHHALLQQGLQTACFRPPSTGSQHSVLRVSLTSEHGERDVDTLLDAIYDKYNSLILSN